MAAELVLPKLGMTMESAKIAEWLKSDGERVERDEIVLTIETDKVLYEVAAPAAGILLSLAKPEEEVPVGATVAVIAVDESEFAAMRMREEKTPVQPMQDTAASTGKTPGAAAAAGQIDDRIRIAPAARKLAQDKGIDVRLLRGTGPEGRITKEDVLNFDRQRTAPAEPAGEPGGGGDGTIVLKRTEQRRIIAQKMMQAMREAAQTTLSQDVDATELSAARNRILLRSEEEAGVRVTITDLLMKLTACAIRRHPIMNSTYTDEADIVYKEIHMGMAMSIRENELLVPVVRSIERKSTMDIARTRIDLQDRARRGRLTPDEIKGGTFTFSGLGMLGLERFAAIINRPENAILAAGAILEKPWVHEGKIEVRKIINLTLTYDHRTIYGAEAARFMVTLKSLIEKPESVLDQEAGGL